MPFIFVNGLPSSTSKAVLRQIRVGIVEAVTASLPQVPKSWTRPYFPADLLDEAPKNENEGAGTIYVRMDSAMFVGEKGYATIKKRVIKALCDVVWKALGGKFEVEGGICKLDEESMVLLPPSPSVG